MTSHEHDEIHFADSGMDGEPSAFYTTSSSNQQLTNRSASSNNGNNNGSTIISISEDSRKSSRFVQKIENGGSNVDAGCVKGDSTYERQMKKFTKKCLLFGFLCLVCMTMCGGGFFLFKSFMVSSVVLLHYIFY